LNGEEEEAVQNKYKYHYVIVAIFGDSRVSGVAR